MLCKKIFTLIASSLILGCSFMFAIANDFANIKIEPEFGILHGQLSEFVFADNCENTDHMLSKLDWDIPALPYFGGDVEISIVKYVYVGVNGRYGIPSSSGNMQDYDWTNTRGTSPATYDQYSKHDNKVDEYYRFAVELGGTLPLPFMDIVKITPVVSYEYNLIQFTAENGKGNYTGNSSRTGIYEYEIDYSNKKVMTYAQECNIFKIGAKISATPVDFLSITSNLYWSPFLTSINAIDCHCVQPKRIAFFDKMEFQNILQADIGVTYNFNKYHKLGLKCGFEYLPLAKGETSTKNLDTKDRPNPKTRWAKTDGYNGGTSHYLWNWALIYSFNF